MTYNSQTNQVDIDSEDAMVRFGMQCVETIRPDNIVHLVGDLGAGKTTLVRGYLRGLGYEGNVVSPTFTLIEPYTLPHLTVYHLDLYRLESSDELEMLGFRDMLSNNSVVLIEWPERGAGYLPDPDIEIQIQYVGSGRKVTVIDNRNI